MVRFAYSGSELYSLNKYMKAYPLLYIRF